MPSYSRVTEYRNITIHRLTSSQLATLPERISYSTVKVESPLGRIVHIPRRELFDVRLQLLQEDTANNETVIDQIDKSDIKAGVYEGGFKTWECSVDLASLLLDRGPRKDIDELVRCDSVIEVRLIYLLSAASRLWSRLARSW